MRLECLAIVKQGFAKHHALLAWKQLLTVDHRIVGVYMIGQTELIWRQRQIKHWCYTRSGCVKEGLVKLIMVIMGEYPRPSPLAS